MTMICQLQHPTVKYFQMMTAEIKLNYHAMPLQSLKVTITQIVYAFIYLL